MRKLEKISVLFCMLFGLSACTFNSETNNGKVFVGNQKTFTPGFCYEKYFTEYGNQLLNEKENNNELIVYQDDVSELMVFNSTGGLNIDLEKSSASKVYLLSDPSSENSSFYLGRSYNPKYPKKLARHLKNPPKIYLDGKELNPIITHANQDLVREPYLINAQ